MPKRVDRRDRGLCEGLLWGSTSRDPSVAAALARAYVSIRSCYDLDTGNAVPIDVAETADVVSLNVVGSHENLTTYRDRRPLPPRLEQMIAEGRGLLLAFQAAFRAFGSKRVRLTFNEFVDQGPNVALITAPSLSWGERIEKSWRSARGEIIWRLYNDPDPEIQRAAGSNPSVYFDRFLWHLTPEEVRLYTDEETRLLMVEELDKERRRFERLKRIHVDSGPTLFMVRTSIPDDVRALVWRRDGGRCRRCGSENDLQFDHIIPHSKGGNDRPDNIEVLCGLCNKTKGATL